MQTKAMSFDYKYSWRNNEKRQTLYGRRCRIVARGALNSIMIEFEDGQREIVSGNSIRRATIAA